jgi:hypothetical protein
VYSIQNVSFPKVWWIPLTFSCGPIMSLICTGRNTYMLLYQSLYVSLCHGVVIILYIHIGKSTQHCPHNMLRNDQWCNIFIKAWQMNLMLRHTQTIALTSDNYAFLAEPTMLRCIVIQQMICLSKGVISSRNDHAIIHIDWILHYFIYIFFKAFVFMWLYLNCIYNL